MGRGAVGDVAANHSEHHVVGGVRRERKRGNVLHGVARNLHLAHLCGVEGSNDGADRGRELLGAVVVGADTGGDGVHLVLCDRDLLLHLFLALALVVALAAFGAVVLDLRDGDGNRRGRGGRAAVLRALVLAAGLAALALVAAGFACVLGLLLGLGLAVGGGRLLRHLLGGGDRLFGGRGGFGRGGSGGGCRGGLRGGLFTLRVVVAVILLVRALFGRRRDHVVVLGLGVLRRGLRLVVSLRLLDGGEGGLALLWREVEEVEAVLATLLVTALQAGVELGRKGLCSLFLFVFHVSYLVG